MRILITGGSGFIGTHLVEEFLQKGYPFLNVDIQKPVSDNHALHWENCNILDFKKLASIFRVFSPTHIIHLAACTTTEAGKLDAYSDNTVGTFNVIQSIKLTPGVSRVIVASSQHVRKPGSGFPMKDDEYSPHGGYGESKVITEQLTRNSNLNCTWTIIRPTTIWGPGHFLLKNGLWHVIKTGRYFHPRNDPVVRSYGYVKNVVWQIEKIMSALPAAVDKKTYYLGDDNVMQINWVNSFSRALVNRDVIEIPKGLIRLLAFTGDLLGFVKIRFPMTSSRYFNLTTENPVPIEKTLISFGVPPFTLAEGVKETVNWLNDFK